MNIFMGCSHIFFIGFISWQLNKALLVVAVHSLYFLHAHSYAHYARRCQNARRFLRKGARKARLLVIGLAPVSHFATSAPSSILCLMTYAAVLPPV